MFGPVDAEQCINPQVQSLQIPETIPLHENMAYLSCSNWWKEMENFLKETRSADPGTPYNYWTKRCFFTAI